MSSATYKYQPPNQPPSDKHSTSYKKTHPSYLVSNLVVGDLVVGDLVVGDLVVSDLVVGDLVVSDLVVSDLDKS